jgi:hypothetical protein
MYAAGTAGGNDRSDDRGTAGGNRLSSVRSIKATGDAEPVSHPMLLPI